MKPISVHVSEDDYQELKTLAAGSGRPVAELIRAAMAEYLARERTGGRSILDIPTHSSGPLLKEWDREELFEEMIGD